MATTIPNAPQEGKEKEHSRIVRYYVWELPVRLTHWIIFLMLIVLSITGYYIHDPYLIAYGRRAYVMGIMRAIHLSAGFVFLASLLVRLYWFFAGNRFAHWRAFIPITKKQRRNLVETIRFYSLQRHSPPPLIGHNTLAALSYGVVYLLYVVEGVTGLVLYNSQVQVHFLNFAIGWIPYLVDIQVLRSIHFFLMFAFWAFMIHHLYSAVLTAVQERNGLMDSIFTGIKSVSIGLVEEETKDDASV